MWPGRVMKEKSAKETQARASAQIRKGPGMGQTASGSRQRPANEMPMKTESLNLIATVDDGRLRGIEGSGRSECENDSYGGHAAKKRKISTPSSDVLNLATSSCATGKRMEPAIPNRLPVHAAKVPALANLCFVTRIFLAEWFIFRPFLRIIC